ncbi:hypothetical protein DFJ77DRAFT_462835 [Powellomyces hirtus]|nr:hypothetical protein DFJ77DRAFT_462835 [Powellomyces hirtus]
MIRIRPSEFRSAQRWPQPRLFILQAASLRRTTTPPLSLKATFTACARQRKEWADGEKADPRRKVVSEGDYRAPRNTIVLCHGLLGFDVMGPSFARLHYWRGVKEALNAIGCDVIITKVPRAADVSVRAAVLKETLDRKVPKGKSVNLVAHSMVRVLIVVGWNKARDESGVLGVYVHFLVDPVFVIVS